MKNLASLRIIPPRLTERLILSAVNLLLHSTKRKRPKKNKLLSYLGFQFFVNTT